jgi:H+/Cl- antiporter ClcA
MGGGAGSWISRRRRIGTEDSRVNTLAGVAGTFAGVFSSPVVVVLLIMEVAHPGGQRFSRALAASIVAGSVSFGSYFAIAGAAAAPFSMVLLTALMTRVGPPQTAPILIAVATAFLARQGMRYLLASRRQARTATGADDSAQKLVCVKQLLHCSPDALFEPDLRLLCASA